MAHETRLKARLIDSGDTTDSPDFPVGQSVFRVGRHPASDLLITESTVSGRHAAIEFQQDAYVIIDQKSTNKTWLNGTALKPQKPYQLKNGDEIRFDAYSFTFELEEIRIPLPERGPVPDLDEDATVVLGGEDRLGGAYPDVSAADSSEDKTTIAGEVGTDVPGSDPDDDETVFFDSEAMLAGMAEPAVPGSDPDDDETVFFDSEAMLADMAEPAVPGSDSDDDETVFLDDSEPVYDMKATFVRKEPATTIERTKIGNYYVSNLLGKGGFGSVWKGITPDGEPVAIKVLNPDVIENERAVRKFFHEAIILSKMDHPNICRFFDFFPYEGNYAIVMDFVKGVELKSLLEEQEGPMLMEKARHIAAQALDAFHYAHMKDILHRDIKPENISVDEEGTVKVMDFGIAKLSTSESQETSLFMISPRYTAPERFDANNTEAVDHRSDIYSLGLVFYEMFTGMHPFQTDSPTEMIVAHVNTVPIPPDEIVDVPHAISDAIMRAVEKDPADRFEDFGAFKLALLNEPPRLSGGGAIELAGQYCQIGTKLFKGLAGAMKRYQKIATSFKVVQEGKEITVIIKTRGGNSIRVSKNLDSL
ncbi:MAG: protein kinase [Desulfobacterales bacterium]|nr:protein kinase [Desulfobacterales bacterium]